jgi:hypothetical protein
MTEDEMVWMCNLWKRRDIHIFSENLKETDNLEDPGLNKQ